MKPLACLPRSVPAFTLARRMSPVERCANPKSRMIFLLIVPLPPPGGPMMRAAICDDEAVAEDEKAAAQRRDVVIVRNILSAELSEWWAVTNRRGK